jgi:hypothetical protein
MDDRQCGGHVRARADEDLVPRADVGSPDRQLEGRRTAARGDPVGAADVSGELRLEVVEGLAE